MSRATHLVSKNIPGYGPPDGQCLPCSGASRRSVSLSLWLSHCDYKTFTDTKITSLKVSSTRNSYACKASSGAHKRNPDFSRQSKHGFSRSRNRRNEERDGSEDYEESEFLSSKNGPLLSFSSTPKFQATAAPGPREREIVELFRKVQAQLRERAATKEEKKIEDFQGKRKDSETVDSLLKLLRKHSVQQGKRNSKESGTSKDFILDPPEQNVSFEEDKITNFVDLNKNVKDESIEHESPTFTRPVSNFQRRSPVPRVKFQPVYSDEDAVDPVSNKIVNGKREKVQTEPKIKHEPEPEPEPTFDDGIVFDGISEDVISDTDEGDTEDDVEEQEQQTIHEDLSAMKLSELRAIAKSRGLKGFSKLKKLELLDFLKGGSI